MKMVELRDVTINFGSKRVLQGINMKFNEGNVYIIRGVNGSGKSTLLDVVSQRLDITSGSVISKYKHQEIIFLDNVEYMFSSLMVKDNLSYYSKLFKTKNYRKEEIINTFLNDELLNQRYCNLSEGNKMRVRLACIFLNENAKLIVLDEPLVNLDNASAKFFEDYLLTKEFRNKIVVCVSHTHFEEGYQYRNLELDRGLLNEIN